MIVLKVTKSDLDNSLGTGGVEIHIEGAVGDPLSDDGCPVFIESYMGEVRVVIWDGTEEPQIIPIKRFKEEKSFKEDEGSKKEAVHHVAICGVCGRDDTEGTTEGCFCKYCGGDYWVELDDFANTKLGKYLEEAAQNIGSTVKLMYYRILSLNFLTKDLS